MKNRILLVAAILGLLATSCKKENENPQNDLTVTPITISTNYGENNGAKVSYTESGDVISATWDAGDQLYVVYNGHVNTLTLTDGAGTASATFTGSIIGTPTAMSVLICYVRDANNTSAVTVSPTGEYTYTSGTFLNQDGTLEGAAKCNLYYGTTTYGTGTDISCTFSPNTSMLKFTVLAPDGVTAGTEGATLTYKSGETEMAKATFTVDANGRNTVYMTIPAGNYSGEQTLVYTSGEVEQTETLSSTQANFVAGQTYDKSITYSSDPGIPIDALGTNSQYIGYVITTNGKAYQTITVANNFGATACAMIAYLGSLNGTNGNDSYSNTYNHGLAVALTDVTSSGGTGSQQMFWASACTAAASYNCDRPSASSTWFLPSIYQWMWILNNCGGGTFTSPSDGMTFSYGNFNSNLTACGGSGIILNGQYWTSTVYDGNSGCAWIYNFSNSTISWQSKSNSPRYARSVFAF